MDGFRSTVFGSLGHQAKILWVSKAAVQGSRKHRNTLA